MLLLFIFRAVCLVPPLTPPSASPLGPPVSKAPLPCILRYVTRGLSLFRSCHQLSGREIAHRRRSATRPIRSSCLRLAFAVTCVARRRRGKCLFAASAFNVHLKYPPAECRRNRAMKYAQGTRLKKKKKKMYAVSMFVHQVSAPK